MAGIGSFGAGAMLNWMLGGGTVTQPAQRDVSLTIVAPSSTGIGGEIATGSGITRQTVGFNSAVIAVNNVTNLAAITFGPISAAATVQGMLIFDTLAATVGNLLISQTLQTARTMAGGDSLVFAAGAIQISMS